MTTALVYMQSVMKMSPHRKLTRSYKLEYLFNLLVIVLIDKDIEVLVFDVASKLHSFESSTFLYLVIDFSTKLNLLRCYFCHVLDLELCVGDSML